MRPLRTLAVALLARMFPERPAPCKPVFSPLSTPFQFNPCLGLAEGLIAVAAVFARILTLCVILAVWGVISLLWWSRIAGQPWRFFALVPILLALPAALIPPMLAIGVVERWMWLRCS